MGDLLALLMFVLGCGFAVGIWWALRFAREVWREDSKEHADEIGFVYGEVACVYIWAACFAMWSLLAFVKGVNSL